ncbi:hypothetical protein TNCV_1184511 [Trichonephila clavipes]|nr:hypothetical protein TNCV_1184511 [Trichonephila clavipes]
MVKSSLSRPFWASPGPGLPGRPMNNPALMYVIYKMHPKHQVTCSSTSIIESRFEAGSVANFIKVSEILQIPTGLPSASTVNPPLATAREILVGLPERVKMRQGRSSLARVNRCLAAHEDYNFV